MNREASILQAHVSEAPSPPRFCPLVLHPSRLRDAQLSFFTFMHKFLEK
jgi:hypothetical protein